jgi:hypothetical protein
MKRYDPHCPSPTCTGGYKYKLYHIKGKPNWLPLEHRVPKKEGQILYRCNYCGLVWFQERSKRPGLDAKPLGYYDNLQHPWEFVSLKRKYRIREQNTSRYWFSVGSKREAMPPPKRGGVD